MFDALIIDVGSALTENAVTIMDMADRIIVVTTPDLASIQDTTRFSQISKTLSYPSDKLYYVLNRTDLAGGVKTKDVTPIINDEFFMIPDGGPNVLRSINRGIPLVLRYPRNPASKSIQNMAAELSKMLDRSASHIPSDGML
jgi:pilus assembly protein CpaE